MLKFQEKNLHILEILWNLDKTTVEGIFGDWWTEIIKVTTKSVTQYKTAQ